LLVKLRHQQWVRAESAKAYRPTRYSPQQAEPVCRLLLGFVRVR